MLVCQSRGSQGLKGNYELTISTGEKHIDLAVDTFTGPQAQAIRGKKKKETEKHVITLSGFERAACP